MNNANNTVIVVTRHRHIYEQLQENLKEFKVECAADVEAINQLVKAKAGSGDNIGAIVIQLANSRDLTAFEFCSIAVSSVPLFAVIDDETGEMQELIKKYGAVAVFSAENTKALANLIYTADNMKRGVRDHNADFLRVFGEISRELGRLHNEFTETALRTLPQPFIARDTQQRLENYLSKLQAITITP